MSITNYNIIIRIRSVYLEIRLDIRKTLMYFSLYYWILYWVIKSKSNLLFPLKPRRNFQGTSEIRVMHNRDGIQEERQLYKMIFHDFP